MSWTKPSAVLVVGVLLVLLLAKRDRTRRSDPGKERSRGPVPALFTATQVPAFALELDSVSMQSLRERPRQWARGTLRVGSEIYPDVAVHIKGSQGSLQPIDARPSLTVSFTKLGKGRKFQGLRKIHFNNAAEDPSFMTEILCGELCRQAGLPAARSAHATLALNGHAPGLYVLTEGLTKEFLGQFFSKTDGNLYDGGFRKDIDQPLERIGGQGPDDQSDRLALLAAAREPDPQRRWERLKQVLDTDRFISLLAMSTILWNWDGYPMARNNYRIYHDPLTDRLVFFPHGQDQMFWEPEGPIYPRLQGLVAIAVMRVPEARALYRERLASLHKNVFRVEAVQRRTDQLVGLIRPYRSDAAQQGARLKHLIEARSDSIAQQLRASPP
jgi:spore coat protein H